MNLRDTCVWKTYAACVQFGRIPKGHEVREN